MLLSACYCPHDSPAVHLPVCLSLWQAALSHIPPSLICSGPVACKMVWGEFVELCLGSRSDRLSRKERVLSVKPARATYCFFVFFFACRCCACQEMMCVRVQVIYDIFIWPNYIAANGLIFRTQVHWFHTDNLLYWSTKVTVNILYCTGAYPVSWKLEACEIEMDLVTARSQRSIKGFNYNVWICSMRTIKHILAHLYMNWFHVS